MSSVDIHSGFNGVSMAKSMGVVSGIEGAGGVHDLNGVNGTNGANGDSKANESNGVNGSSGPNVAAKSATSNCHFDNTPESNLTAVEPIAIIGMAMRLPGGIHDAETFWDLLINKKDARCRVPADRYNIDAFYGPNKLGHVGMEYGYFLDDVDLQHLDTSFFSMTKNEVEVMDPQQRQLLEVVYECLQNGGQVGYRGKNIGVFVGSFGEDWLELHAKEGQNAGMYRITGYGDFVTANRISYEFNLTGPSTTTRTACSSALTALHEACQAVRTRECSEAIVAGTNLILSPSMTVAMTEQGVLSPSASCKSFDADADGYARGEAVSALHIKPFSEALKNGDPIRAVIRSTSINSDGKTSGLSCPSSESHTALIRRAYKTAGIEDLSQTAFVECHGTGTARGDPLETTAVANVFREKGVYIGSVKPNVGHSEGASGITSIIKTVLALEKRIIPPNIKFHTPNPRIPFQEAQLQVPVEPTPWPKFRAERASVNSFGIGGANAHVVLDSAASMIPGEAEKPSTPTTPQLLIFSANHPDSLRRMIEDYEVYLTKHPLSLADLSYTLGCRREHLLYRAFCVTSPGEILTSSPAGKMTGVPEIALIFTGQGAQWPQMGANLIEDFAVFRETINQLDKYLSVLGHQSQWTIKDEIARAKDASRIQAADFSQPCCTAVQIGLVNLLQSCGISPAAVVGHSSGEIAAAYACEAISAEEAITIAFFRGQVTKKLVEAGPQKGAMAALGLGRDEAIPFLDQGVVIACENSPNSVTISGDKTAVDGVVDRLKVERPDVFARHLQVEIAYHSHHMREVEDFYLQLLLDHIHPRSKSLKIPFFSSVSGKRITNSEYLSPQYWCQNLVSPVLFHSAMKLLLQNSKQKTLLLEVGPHSALAGPLRQILKSVGLDYPYLASMVRDKNATISFLNCAGQLFMNSVPIRFQALIPGRKVLTDLPIYPWNYDTKYWSESRLSQEWRLRKFAHHDILGSPVVESNTFEPSWRNLLRLDEVPWIREHVIGHDIVFPGAGYVSMAGEAIRQLTGCSDYSVRHVNFNQALVLHETKATEMITNFRHSRLTDSLDSSWYDFSISSYTGSTWIKHCTGQARGGTEITPRSASIDPLPREVSSNRWYKTMKSFGLNYGKRFKGLSNITSDPLSTVAVGHVADLLEPFESKYELHPCTIDLTFQLFSVAAFKGAPRLFDRLSIPRYIEELYIGHPTSDLRVRADAIPTPRGSFDGNALGITEDGTVVFDLKGLKLAAVGDDNEDDRGDNPHAGVELVWRPALDFVDPKTLVHPTKDLTKPHLLVERLALLCMLETSDLLASKKSGLDHMEFFRTWVDGQKERCIAGTYENVEDIADLAQLDSSSRLQLINTLYEEALHSEGASIATAVYRTFENVSGLYDGRSDPLEILHDILPQVYDFGQLWDYSGLFCTLAHEKPNLKILEIGAGTGGTTAKLLEYLVSENRERMYFSYTYTDISSGFFVAARERFSDAQTIEYAVLDISHDPLDQGFEEHSYDLVIASNVVHATPKLQDTLRHVHKLLRPDGRFFLQELCPQTRWINYVMGTFPGWWLGRDDNRIEEPYVSPGNWEQELLKAGFQNILVIGYDGQFNANIMAHPSAITTSQKRLTILVDSTSNSQLDEVQAAFHEHGYKIDLCTLSESPRRDQNVVSLLDLTGPFAHSLGLEKFKAMQNFIDDLGSCGLLWVTKACQIDCEDPRYAMTLGLARTIRIETEVKWATLELENFDKSSWDILANVFRKYTASLNNTDNELDPDFEWAVKDGVVCTSRFSFVSVRDALSAPMETKMARKLDIGKRGFLQTLRFVQYEPVSVQDDYVEVEMRAVGLNFKDVLISMGIVEGQKVEGDGLGCEGSGIVRQAGPASSLKPGDRVIVFASGSFSTRLVTTSKLCVRMADDLDFTDAASMPCVYGTVIHSLLDMARLQKNQTVLIHSACGGVGIAAIQICRMVGAKILVTVGSDDKVNYLMKTFGIPRNHIFNSRNISFLSDVKTATNGIGVDVVLNSLSGELLHASWKCVAEFGTMIEIGKRDLIGNGNLALGPFEQNRSYIGVDFAQICAERPDITSKLLKRCMDYYRQGKITPIHPIKVFEAAQVEDAFRYMQKGSHIGKIVVTMPEDQHNLSVASNQEVLHLRSDSSYLLVGGLGGLGRSVAIWMAENGAKSILFLSRSASKFTAEDPFYKELEALGCKAQVFAGSVVDFADIKRVVQEAHLPIAGVMQISMVLKDCAFDEMSFEDWKAPIMPKVQGTWNLHEALKNEPLDFFVLFSSWSGLRGQRGQASYAAANSFLDAFVQFRHHQGLPASVLDIGVMEDIGYVSANPSVLEHFRSTATHVLHEQDLLDSLQVMIQRSRPLTISEPNQFKSHSQLAIGLRSTLPLDAPNNRTSWKRDRRMAVYRNYESSGSSTRPSTNEGLKQLLMTVSTSPMLLKSQSTIDFISNEIGTTLFSFMLRPMEELALGMSLDALGVDSLVAIELRNWFRQKLGIDMSVIEILGSASIQSLGEVAAAKLLAKFSVGLKSEPEVDSGNKKYLDTKAP